MQIKIKVSWRSKEYVLEFPDKVLEYHDVFGLVRAQTLLSTRETHRIIRRLVAEGKLKHYYYTRKGLRYSRYRPIKQETFEDIGIDSETGFEIKYSLENEEYVLFDKEKEIKRTKSIEVSETLSIETEKGHELPFVCELTSKTSVSKMGRKDVNNLEKGIQTSLDDFFHKQKGFDQIKNSVLKTGVEYRMTDKTTYPKTRVLIEKSQPVRRKVIEEEIEI